MGHSSKICFGAWQYEQPGLWIGGGLIWLTFAGSFISRVSILLIRVVILVLTAMDDSKDRSSPLEAIDCEFLGFSEVGGFSQVDLQINPNPDFHSFARISPDTWFLIRFLFDNPNHYREFGTDTIFLHCDERTELKDLWITQSISRMVHFAHA